MRTGFSATMQRMLTRRTLVGMAAAALAGNALASRNLVAQAVAGTGQATAQAAAQAGTQFSVMIWTLNKLGTFEENLQRVAQAGYNHVELVGEFKKWLEDDFRCFLARMETLRVSGDATSGVSAGFADPSGGDAFLSALKALIPAAQRLECKQIIMLSGKRMEGAPAGAQHTASIEGP